MSKAIRGVTVMSLALLLGGCAVRTRPQSAHPVTPETWSQQGDGFQTGQADLTQWWKGFQDPVLDSLIERAVRGNLDLRIAEERVREARATRGYTAATRQLPNTGLDGGFTQTRRSSRSPVVPSLGDTSGGRDLVPNQYGMYQAGFDASYELDLFGGGRASVSAAEADAQAAEESLRHTRVSVIAEMARNYVELRESQERLEVARKTLAGQQELLRLTSLREQAGFANDLEVTRARALVESTRAGIPSLEAQAQRAIHALAVLLGEQPGTLEPELGEPGSIPVSPPEVPVGLPSDLLRRRPDIRQAERELAGAAARVGVAVSSLYPKFSLTGRFGSQSGTLVNLLSGAARLWSFGPSFSWGLLNYPATHANIRAAEAREQQQVANYEKTVLTALADVEDALVSLNKEQQRQQALANVVEAEQRGVRLANERFSKGMSSFLEVLDAQRSLYSAEDALTQSRSAQTTTLVALYKALGGGW